MALNPIVFTEGVVRSFLRYQLMAHPPDEVCSREVMRTPGRQPRILLTDVQCKAACVTAYPPASAVLVRRRRFGRAWGPWIADRLGTKTVGQEPFKAPPAYTLR